MLTIKTLDWIRKNTCEKFQKDISIINWLINCEYLEDVKKELDKEISQGILTSSKFISEQKFINYLLNK
jgi:phenylalanine-4-hydroxylase